jgi:hypothetical protein
MSIKTYNNQVIKILSVQALVAMRQLSLGEVS